MIFRNLRYAARSLRRAPGFVLVTILTFGLGIGTTAAVFSVVYAVMLRPLPFPHADRLVQVVQLVPAQTTVDRAGLSPEQVAEWRVTSRTLAAIGYYRTATAALTGVAAPVRLNGSSVSVELFSALGVAPLQGRLFQETDEQPGGERVVLLSHRTWAVHFGSDPAILTRSVTLNEHPHRVIGVMPAAFGFPSLASTTMPTNSSGELVAAPEFWTPLAAVSRALAPAQGGFTLVPTLALLRPGVTLEQAAAEANTLMPARTGARFRIEIVGAREEQARASRSTLLMFQIAAAFVLLIACANVVNLMLVRVGDRRHEMAIRLALGAGRVQAIGQAVSEAVLLALAGGVLGGLIAHQAAAVVRSLPPYVLPRLQEIRIDWTVLLFIWILCGSAGIAVGLVSIYRAMPRDQSWVPGAAPSLASAARSRAPRSRWLVAFQMAAAFVLVTGAVLLLGSFMRLVSVNPGFAPERIVTFRLSLPQGRYPTAAAQYAFHDQLGASLRDIPGVEAVTASSSPPGRGGVGFSLAIDGKAAPGGVAFQTTAPGFFSTLGIPVRFGREFSSLDRGARATVALVNEAFVRKYFGTTDVLGRRLTFQDWPSLEVVGVVGDSRFIRFDGVVTPELYVPQEHGTAAFRAPTYAVRTTSTGRDLVAVVRGAVARLDAAVVVSDVRTVATQLALSSTSARIQGLTSAAFAVVAVVLAVVGLYGLQAYSVSRRAREFGIRLALGANPKHLFAAVLREALVISLIGIVVGAAGALYASRFLKTLLFELSSHDPRIFLAVGGLFTIAACLASCLPARRAMRVDPASVLRPD